MNDRSMVRVLLTEDGERVYQNYCEEMQAVLRQPYDAHPKDQDGYRRFQFWKLLQLFGEWSGVNSSLFSHIEVLQ